ncbi:glycosyltransferase family 2 protein [Flavobacteriaceae bacterium F89]|uniref:Glycosyltransferase family 2 protein n=1 Tax=Cerina litoralis TaxID=2874477 RepID=A0AAE3EUH9_9FLAO|nr:glycosyltransferase family 2 protein [Cerina litoralis]MCG2459876.1 glycosyltransferase family 2 protein [Cerina litoralis]
MTPSSCSLIVSTYNWPEALELVLKSIMGQKMLPDEVVIADDGSTPSTQELIKKYQGIFPIPLKHVWHADMGFTRTLILNKAIREVTSDYIVQIDGDIVLHPYFISDHLNFAEADCWTTGSRVLLDSKKSMEILKTKNVTLSVFTKGITNHFNAIRSPFLRKLLFSAKKLDIKKVRGCNMAYWKSDFEKVNGYNEDIIGWGREDSEFAARLINNNIHKKNLKLGGIEFHIFHPEESREKLSVNDNIQEETIVKKIKYCKNGYHQEPRTKNQDKSYEL